eukprot:TRINITY_DN5689_c0_g1_i7.p1 TRINITY_DN5689_c0_g1~~TRINITY_DN5689_c0_g1_i7.p1  ORF type:complete len:205 (+),score=33.49 TRINITY_DN5689_c0_g1_i7:66-680(+)
MCIRDRCNSCFHPFIRSSVSFDVLPLVEFKLSDDLSHSKFLELISGEKSSAPKKKKKTQEDDGWNEANFGNEQVLTFNKGGNDDGEITPFIQKMNETQEMQITNNEYIIIEINEEIAKSMIAEEVVYADYSIYCSSYGIRYFKNMVPEIQITTCPSCLRHFLLDEYEYALLENKCCPFCKHSTEKKEKNSGGLSGVLGLSLIHI